MTPPDGTPDETPGALRGLLVADFSRVLAGPYATMMLADLGADVVKVERPGRGDDTRWWGPPYAADGQPTYFHSVNRNKRSVALDLATDSGRQQARELADRADIVVENFTPGTMARFGLDYSSLSASNPGLIYASISGFGAGGGAHLPGYDLLVQAMGGLMSITGPHPGAPTKTGVAVVDVLTGLHAVTGILAALHHRDRTGVGQHVQVNLLSSLLSSLVNQSAAYVVAGVVPGIMGNAHPSIAPYEVYPTADGDLVVAVGNDGQFRSLVTHLGVPELADDARFATNPARVAHRAGLNAVLTQALAAADARHWQRVLTVAGVPCGAINQIDKAFALAESLGLAPIAHLPSTDTDGRVPTVASPLTLSATPVTYRSAPPQLPSDGQESTPPTR